jgi:hypothetical protein
MKKLLVFLFFVFSSASLFAQTDSVDALFKDAKITGLHADIGYSGVQMKGHGYNGVTVNYAFILEHKFGIGMGIDSYGRRFGNGVITGVPTDAPNVYTSQQLYYLNFEYLLFPSRLVNLSFPVKVALASVSLFDTIAPSFSTSWSYYGKTYYQHADNFFTIAPGVNLHLNVFKAISIGVGANYRIAMGVNKVVGEDEDFSGPTFLAFVRFKLDMIAYRKRVLERQKEFLKQQEDMH